MPSAIDRRAIFEAIQGTLRSGSQAIGVAGSWFPPLLRQHRPDLRIHPYDGAKAKSLLAEAGFSDAKGLPELELLIPSGSQRRQIEAEIIKTQLAAVGIRVKIGTQPPNTFFAVNLGGAATAIPNGHIRLGCGRSEFRLPK